MTASYIDIYNRRTRDDSGFLARLEVAVVYFAIYCKNTDTNPDWWPEALRNPAAKVQAMAWEVCFDPAIVGVADSKDITDQALQHAVEAVCLRY
jgi:hypothetical protein